MIDDSKALVTSMPGRIYEYMEQEVESKWKASVAFLLTAVMCLSGAFSGNMLKAEARAGDIKIQNLTGKADSEQSGQPGSYAVDKDTQTHWHTNWSQNDVVIDGTNPDNCKNNGYTIDLGNEYSVTKLEYLPRQGAATDDNGIGNGRIGRYRLLYSTTGEANDFHEITLTGNETWENSGDLKTASFEPVNARYIRIEALATYGAGTQNDKFVSAAEFYVYRANDGSVECTCKLSEPQFTGKSIQIPYNQSSTKVSLSASSSLSGDCELDGHDGAQIQYTYTIEKDQNGIASLQGNTLTVSKEGSVTVQVTASANGKESSKSAVFKVTKEPVPCTCKLEFNSFEGQEITLGYEEAEREIPLDAQAELKGDCKVDGHAGAAIVYTYKIEKGAEIAEITGNILKVKDAGQVTVRADAAVNGKTASKNADFSVDREPAPQTFSLTFMGGEEAQGTAPETLQGIAGTVVTLPANSFTRSDYEFTGWSDGTQTYVPGAEYTIQNDVLFTAVWTKIDKQPDQVPGTPKGLKAVSNKTTSIKLTWDKVDGAAGYVLYRYNSTKKTWDQIAAPAGNSYTDKKLKTACVYQYQVKARIQSGNQVKDSQLSPAYKTSTTTKKPVIKVKKQSGSKVKISWSKVKGSSGYSVEVKAPKGKFEKQKAKKPHR